VAASGSSDGVVTGTAVRCAESLRLATDSLDRARKMAAAGRDELVAAEIRTALVELGKVVGEVYSDDVLDSIFSRFCVGK
jgi:tRNA modification GTPase